MKIGVIGGSGLYGLGEGESLSVETPFGSPSGSFEKQTHGPNELYFLPRHGVGHVLLPTEINYRANIFAFKKLGVEALVSISAVGSLRKEIEPGHFVFPDQYIDVTKGLRPHTFFGDGVVAHAHFADPTCAKLRKYLTGIARELDIPLHEGGTYVCMEGPQFSTRAESHLYRAWGANIIGMTALPEARLAREAGLSYQTVAMATDYDCWNTEKGDVSLQEILKVLGNNVKTSQRFVKEFVGREIPSFGDEFKVEMQSAVVTAREKWPASQKEILDVILG